MALQMSTALRNARANQIATTVGASAYLQIRSGAQPSDASQADSGTLLCEIPLPATWLGAAASGAVAKSGTWSATAAATGTAAHFRLKDTTKTTTHLQGSVTATGGGGDLTLVNTSIASGQTVTINTFTSTEANA
jgi:hypothetical protein